MLSRVVDVLYWMSRYLERGEHTARMLDVHLNLMLDVAPGMMAQQRLIRLKESLSLEEVENLNDETLVRDLTFEPDLPGGIITSINLARENARHVREQISSEMWMQINKLYLYAQQPDTESHWENYPHDFYVAVREGVHLFQGITDATMNHNQGWHFIQAGRHIERALNLLRLLDVHFADTHHLQRDAKGNQYFELMAILKSVTAWEAYCKVYNPALEPVQLVEFLLYNPEFPRSLRFCVDSIVQSLHSLATATGRSRNSRLYRIAGRLQSTLSYDEIEDIYELHGYLWNIQQQIFQIHDTLYSTYITYPIETAL